MDKKTRVALAMQNTVTTLLDTYQDVLAADADLLAGEQERQPILARWRVVARLADVQTPPATANKETVKARVITELLKPLGRVSAWAARTKNAAAEASADVTFTDLDQTPEEELGGKLEGLMTFMRGVVAQVPTVPTAQLDGLDDQIDGLVPLLGSPRSMVVDRSAAQGEMERKRREARLVLEGQHDKIIRSYEHSAPATPLEVRQRELFDRWDAARMLVDEPTTPHAAATPPTPPATGGGTAGPK